jgi:hypothetical protein
VSARAASNRKPIREERNTMHRPHEAARRPRTKLAAVAGLAVLAVAAGPAVGAADAAKAKTTTLKPKTLIIKIDAGLTTAVEAAGISFGPLAPATGDAATGITLKTKGSIKVKGKTIQKSTLTLSGGLNLDATALLGQAVGIKDLKVAINGAKGTVNANVDLLGQTDVLEIQGQKVSGKKITGKLVFAAGVGAVLGAVLPEAATGKPFGTYSVQ